MKRSMITPSLESFPEDFSVEVDGDTYTALLPTEPRAASEEEEECCSSQNTDDQACERGSEANDDKEKKSLEIKIAATDASKSIAYQHKQSKIPHLDNMMGMRAIISGKSMIGKGVVAKSMI